MTPSFRIMPLQPTGADPVLGSWGRCWVSPTGGSGPPILGSLGRLGFPNLWVMIPSYEVMESLGFLVWVVVGFP